ncbi:hypothetical protein N0V83_009567 [Neocucurbitaria cava]|uniref:Uncharacterized protein n=1 Tax=Neocucurbitaria cava TaxID=798079 RepID=A0A9W9CHN7_9PLEO|nr:hypothetical protein N0V83_009567 [Neocucurbitaria cava]
MTKFTMSAFKEATTTTTSNRKERPARITIPASNLHLPIAPPSPYFDGINTEINTEPFPLFMDISNPYAAVEQAESPHCVQHCHETLCKRMKRTGRTIPPCCCVFETAQRVVVKQAAPSRPALHIYDSVMDTLAAISTHDIDPDQEIDIHLIDVSRLLIYLENNAVNRVLKDQGLQNAFRHHNFPYEPTSALETVEDFFADKHEYFRRTLCGTPCECGGHRVLSVRQLRMELDVYAWTMLDKWVDDYCNPAIARALSGVDMRLFSEIPWSGAPRAVLEIWNDCADDVVGMMVWRDHEVRQFEADQRVMASSMLALTSVFIVVAIAIVLLILF